MKTENMNEDFKNFLIALETDKRELDLYIAQEMDYSILIRSRIRSNFRIRLTLKRNERGKEMKQAILNIFNITRRMIENEA